MKKLPFLLSILLVSKFSFCKTDSAITDKIFIKVEFREKARFFLDYIDTKYRNANIDFRNRYSNDTIILKYIITDKPLEICYTKVINNQLFKMSFLAEQSDTLSFVYENDELLLKDDSKGFVVSKVFGIPALSELNKEFKNDNLKQHFLNVEAETKSSITKLIQAKANYNLSDSFYNALLKYYKTRKYSKLFAINFEAAKHTNENLKLLNYYYKELLKDRSILDSIYCGAYKSILYNLIKFLAWSTNNEKKQFYANVRLLDSTLLKTKFLDGFLFDKMFNDGNLVTISERRKLLKTLQNLVLDESSFLSSRKFNTSKVPDSVLLTRLELYDGSITTFGKLLTTNKYLIFDFWASWCVPCISEIPSLKRIKEKYKSQIEVFSISIDESRDKWKQGCLKHKVLTNSVLNIDGKNSHLIQFFKIESIPRFILITSKGEVIETDFYKPSNKKFEFELNNILNTK